MINNNKKLVIFISKYNLFKGQVEKIKKQSNNEVEIINIEDFNINKNIYSFNEKNYIYFLCCNSSLVNDTINEIKKYNCKIINKEFLSENFKKKEIQERLDECNVVIPKIYETPENYPCFVKENRHQGITAKIYNKVTATKIFEKFNIKDFYFEESVSTDNSNEVKYYYVFGKVYDDKFRILSYSVNKICRKISKSLMDMDIFSVDIINKNNKKYVIDINASAGFYLSDIARKAFIKNVEK